MIRFGRLALALLAAAFCLAAPSGAGAGLIEAFTEQVSPEAETNATEPSVAVDRSDGTIYVAWQASGTDVARSDDGGRTFVQTPIVDLFGRDVGDVDVRVGGPTPCVVPVPFTSNGVAASARFDVPSGIRSPGGCCSLPK